MNKKLLSSLKAAFSIELEEHMCRQLKEIEREGDYTCKKKKEKSLAGKWETSSPCIIIIFISFYIFSFVYTVTFCLNLSNGFKL